jgi:hypothetical protein
MICVRPQVPLAWLCIVCFALLTRWAAAQDPTLPAIPAGELVREAVHNEVAGAEHPVAKHFFRSHKQTPKGSQTRLYVETRDAMAGMLIAVNDHPLTSEQQRSEENRLNWLAGNPDQLRKKSAREKEDADRTLQIVRALPDAFLYEYADTDNGSAARQTGTPLVRLNFRPNPTYSPPSHVERALEGMQGYLLIDATHHRIARIDGTLFKDVEFGWGILGRLDKGGHFFVQQSDLGDGSWDITEMKLNFRGKILLFKSLTMESDEHFDDYQRVPDTLTFAQGAQMLEKQEKPVTPSTDKTTPQ